jgi:hypothetical protein
VKPALVAQTLLPSLLKMAARSTLPVPTRLLGVGVLVRDGWWESLGSAGWVGGYTWCQRMLCMDAVSWVGSFLSLEG